MSPIGSSAPVSSPTRACRRRASRAPRVWIPTSAKPSGSGFFSAISWAIRRSVRLRSSCSSTTFSLILWLPSWPLGTGLKDGAQGTREAAGRGRPSPAQQMGRLGRGPTRPRRRRGLRSGRAGVSALGEGDLDLVEVARGDDRLERPRGPRRGSRRRGSGRRCGRGRAASRAASPATRGGLARGRVAGFGGPLRVLRP